MRILSGSIKIAFGFGAGVVAASALKDVLPAFRGLGKPILKATVKSGLILARDSRTRLAAFREAVADAAAEAQTELASDSEPVPVQEFTASSKQAGGLM
jgi:Protein of unknown function (DUF5132)